MTVQRREFITLLGGAAAAWPRVARAQQQTAPTIGFLHEGTPEGYAPQMGVFRQGLNEAGFFEGRNLKIEYRWARFDNARLPELAADLVSRKVAVIATPGSPAATLAAKEATATIPIVFSTSGDPVDLGIVASLNRPGGNATGLYDMNSSLLAKQLSLLSQLKLNAGPFAALIHPMSVYRQRIDEELTAAAAILGRESEMLYAATNREIDEAFGRLASKPVAALVVVPSSFFFVRRVQIATLAIRHIVPVFHQNREYAEVGGLMSYGSNVTERNREVGHYVGRILKGEKPADLPVMRPSKYEFVINLQTARTLGIEIPPTLLAIADELIE